MAAAAGAFLKSLAIEPPIKPGTPDPYTPPKPGQMIPQEYLQIGPITQFVTTLQHPNGQPPDVQQHQPEHGLNHAGGA
jgi:arylsulfatase